MTTDGVSSVPGAPSSGSAVLRVSVAHASNVMTGTPSTSSAGSTRDTYDASARW